MHNPVFEAVLFDMDGVVVDTEEVVARLWLDVAARYALELTPHDFSEHIYGRKAIYTLEVLFPQMGQRERDQFFADLEVYENEVTYRAIPGVIDLLRALKRSGVRTALVTSAQVPKVQAVSEQLGLNGLFDALVTADDIGEGKPDPGCYLLGARKLGKSSGNCIVFEDAKIGAQAAVAAGTRCIGINRNPHPLLGVGAAFVIPDFTAVTLHTERDRLWLDFPPDHRVMLKTG